MLPEHFSRFICHFYYRDSKLCRAKSLLICRCSNRKWHFKEPSDGGTYNATKCKPPFQHDLPLSSSLSHHPGFTVTTTWHSRLSANINSTLCCSVVSTMPNGTLARNPSTVTVGEGHIKQYSGCHIHPKKPRCRLKHTSLPPIFVSSPLS